MQIGYNVKIPEKDPRRESILFVLFRRLYHGTSISSIFVTFDDTFYLRRIEKRIWDAYWTRKNETVANAIVVPLSTLYDSQRAKIKETKRSITRFRVFWEI